MKNEKNSISYFALIAIVAIVAIVALVVMINGKSNLPSTTDNSDLSGAMAHRYFASHSATDDSGGTSCTTDEDCPDRPHDANGQTYGCCSNNVCTWIDPVYDNC